jgi:tetrahydromethanopterin S-methyltransferase subunit H
MRKFDQEQKVYRIGDVEIGGQPGERPTVLIGSIFFARHQIVQDARLGIFDEEKADALLNAEAEVSAFTGNPRFVDPVGDTSEALIRYIEFIARRTTAPILVDSPLQKVRIEALRHFSGTDLMSRLVYNSIAEDRTEQELAAIRASGIQSAIVLAFSMKAMKPAQRVKLLEDELLPAAFSAGIKNILIDTGVLDIASASWSALCIREVKARLGYPAGCAPANAICTWEKMKVRGQTAYTSAMAAALAMMAFEGADFLLYGPMRFAPWVYPAIAAANALVAYGGRLAGVRPVGEQHPLYRVF